jgi:hypothetical protein
LKDDGNVKGNGSEMRDDMGANDGEDRVAIPVESARNVDICCMDVKSDGWYGYVLIIGEHKATLQQRSNDESAMMPLGAHDSGVVLTYYARGDRNSRGTNKETAFGVAATINL